MTITEKEELLAEVRGGIRGFDSLPPEMLGDDGGHRVVTEPDSATLGGRDEWIDRITHLMDSDQGDTPALDGRDLWLWRLEHPSEVSHG